MDQVEVKFRTTVVTHRYGTFSTGDLLRTDAEFARHLVEDCGAADYVEPAKVDGAQAAAGQLQGADFPVEFGEGGTVEADPASSIPAAVEETESAPAPRTGRKAKQ